MTVTVAPFDPASVFGLTEAERDEAAARSEAEAAVKTTFFFGQAHGDTKDQLARLTAFPASMVMGNEPAQLLSTYLAGALVLRRKESDGLPTESEQPKKQLDE